MIIPNNNIFEQEVLPDMLERRQNILDGNINSLPFNFGKLSNYVFGIEHARQYGITAPSGGSKSKLGRDMFLFQPFDYYHRNKDKMNIDIRVNIFCLEDAKKKVTYNLLAKLLWDNFNIRMPIKELESATNTALPEDIVEKSKGLTKYFDSFFSKVYMSNTTNPTGIKKEIESYLTDPKVGNYVTADGKKLDNKQKQYEVKIKAKDGTIETKQYTELQQYIHKGGQVRYEKVNKNLFVINIIDNLQAITEEKGNTKYKTLDDFCRNLMRNRLCEFFGCANVLVQQQNQGSRQIKTDQMGEKISDTLIPSIAGLGEFKNSVQTMHYLFGIYSPFNDGLTDFNKYNISNTNSSKGMLGYYYRHMYILKSNYMANVNFPVFADPIAETFEDLPSYDDTAGLQVFYDRIANLEGIRQKSIQKLL